MPKASTKDTERAASVQVKYDLAHGVNSIYVIAATLADERALTGDLRRTFTGAILEAGKASKFPMYTRSAHAPTREVSADSIANESAVRAWLAAQENDLYGGAGLAADHGVTRHRTARGGRSDPLTPLIEQVAQGDDNHTAAWGRLVEMAQQKKPKWPLVEFVDREIKWDDGSSVNLLSLDAFTKRWKTAKRRPR